MGSTGSRLLGGNHAEHIKLEEAFCLWKGATAALCFVSGFQANLSVFQTIAKIYENPMVFSDARNHASMIDGMRLARLDTQIYPHLAMGELRNSLAAARENFPDRTLVVATEAVFSMTGLVVPQVVSSICKEYNALLVVDEAHSVGVLGDQCEGLFRHVPNLVLVHPCGKALASSGAVVTGSQAFIDALLQEGRGFVYSTGMSPWLAKGIRIAVQWVQANMDTPKDFLKRIRNQFDLAHPIFSLPMGSNAASQKAADFLRSRGWFVLPIRYPTVPRGQEMLRLSLNPGVDLDLLQADMQEMHALLDGERS